MAQKVAARVVPVISVALAEPAAFRNAITVAGINCIEEVLMTENKQMASEGDFRL